MNRKIVAVGAIAIALLVGGSVLGGGHTVDEPVVKRSGAADSPLAFSATILDERATDGDPAVLELSATNTGDEPVVLHSGPLPPFGVVYASPTLWDPWQLAAMGERVASGQFYGGDYPLWRDAYAASDEIDVSGWGLETADVGYRTRIGVGETVSETFEIGERGLASGTYTIDREQPYGFVGGPNNAGAVSYRITVDVSRE
ncbi:hypothetical protein BRC90_04525 [Halobacteriales archaeon QS_4_69_34]|nr:MAG: hypothetical protein BRC90_04525 [Halobacteriales archaeon QS_4_69_34]